MKPNKYLIIENPVMTQLKTWKIIEIRIYAKQCKKPFTDTVVSTQKKNLFKIINPVSFDAVFGKIWENIKFLSLASKSKTYKHFFRDEMTRNEISLLHDNSLDRRDGIPTPYVIIIIVKSFVQPWTCHRPWNVSKHSNICLHRE